VSDTEVRSKALDPEKSFLVEAPAGSGKTELLIQRYLRLLSVVDQPESIVALTFTRKAAAEMKERVLAALRDAGARKPVKNEYARTTRQLADAALTRSSAREWNILEDARRLQIGTIDSFCSLLTRQMPLLFGFGSNPDVIEFATELYHLAARRAIIALAEHPDFQPTFAELTLHFDGDLKRLEALIAGLLSKRDQWIRKISEHNSESLRDDIDALLQEELVARLRAASNAWPLSIPNRLRPELECLEQWCFAAGLLLTKEGSPLKRKKHTATLEANPEFCELLHLCRVPIPTSLSDEQWNLIRNFTILLKTTLFKLEDVFRDRGQVDFTRVAEAAVEALGEPDRPTELAFRLDFRIEHLLVDEFQDTSIVQYELLGRVTAQWTPGDRRTLFLVGDPMQSIYRFRDAEVGLFLDIADKGIGSLRPEVLRLQRNFRSKPALVEWVNQTFTRIAPAKDDPARGDVALRPAEPARDEAGSEPEIHMFVDDKDGRTEAATVVELCQKALKKKNTSVAILVRTRNHLSAILPALRKDRVPYEAVDLDSLKNEQHILDLLSLTRALHQVADRASWLACLRAPFCGLKLHDLAALAENRAKVSIVDLLSDPDQLRTLSSDGRNRASRFCEVMIPALANFGRYPISQLVESAWIALGGPAALLEDSQREDAASFFSLLESTDEGGRISDFSLLEARLEFLFARPGKHSGPCVQIMTIHKAKGLQFDTVIVPKLDRKSGTSDRDLLVWATRLAPDRSERFLIAGLPQSGAKTSPDNLYYNFVSSQCTEKEKAEEKRLLYVAVTRAKNTLHLLGNVESRKSEPGVCKPWKGSFLHLLWTDELRAAFEARQQKQMQLQPVQRDLLLAPEPGTMLRRLPAGWALPLPEPALPWRPEYRVETASKREPTYEWVSETGRHVGTIVHDLLRRIADEGLSYWTAAKIDRLVPFADRELRRLGVSAAERPAAVERVLAALKNVLASDRGRWILHPHRHARCESALGGLVDGRLESARMDRTFVDEEGVRWVIDYKTSTHEGSGRERFLKDEEDRYRLQLETYAKLLKQSGETRVAVGLYFPLLDEWIAWEVGAEEPAAVIG
jgi:ATP-dependent exoDNAse (exonuclease V) beta subunit